MIWEQKEKEETNTTPSDDGDNSEFDEYALYIDVFPEWAANQSFKGGFFCRFEMERAVPFVERADEMWAIWANHDCSNWEVMLTLVMTRETTGDVIATAGFDQSNMDCERLGEDGESALDQCEYKMKVNSENFALLF